MAIEDCDVFLSFRGEIRRNFTCHVSRELKRKGFQPFMDSESIKPGDEIHEIIKKAIKHSKSAIVILSDEFASSKHCLNELVLILERNRMPEYFIIPVFYYVETDDVKHRLGKFGAAFEQMKKQHKYYQVEEWITALASIGGILGKEIKEQNGLMESTIIEDILDTFEQKFYDHYPKSLQNHQLMPPTTSTTLNIVESPAAATSSRLEDTGSSSRLIEKEWKTKCKKFVRDVCVCICVFITLLIILPIISERNQKLTLYEYDSP
ncbi:hypothetical protein POM88_044414 [Heracleum sosnowskyi]|uniref:ADP-ribosyl cyclase/cyclic ADP-ribose hydrolase n=1 Tax=Heracleum sosnowskyi TaxID=360622 RepID=A0AAD8M2U8_9APIA|nr:hypothetical protein POM88_044414 [Heracleum sosnowskyi]